METTAPLSPEKMKNIPSVQFGGARKLPDLSRLASLVTHADTPHELTTVRAPFTGETLGAVPICTTDDVQLAIQRARIAQHTWAQTPLSER